VVRIASPTFVGRAAELAALDEALDSAAQGHATTVLISGDAGVGKSRLLDTWNERIRERGARIAAGSCLDLGESGPAYVAIVQAFHDLLAPLDPVAVDELVGSDRSGLGQVIPELLVQSGTAGDRERSMPIAQTRVFDVLVRVLERASSDTPLVLELEDVHWADPSTRAFLVYLVANAGPGRLLIVATVRAEEASVDHPVTAMLRQLGRHRAVATIDLQPFDRDELREQLLGILGEPPTNRALAAIHARSEGNALFAEELIASGDPTAELPSSIGAALLYRTAGLSPAARVALRVASVAGRTASYDLLRASTALTGDGLDSALREVVSVNILVPEHTGERYRFRHALLQEAIYRDTLPGERRRLHAAVAEAIEADAENRPDDPVLASQLAFHWSEAKDDGRALKASIAAGDAAMRQAGYVEALHHYERVIELWDRAPLAHADLGRADILERASRAANLAGEPHHTVAYAQHALDELDVTDHATQRVRLLDGIVDALKGMVKHEEAIEYERRLAEIDPDGLPVREQMVIGMSRVAALRWQGNLAAATEAASDSIRLADAIDDPALKGDAHLRMAWILLQADDIEGGIAAARRAGSLASTAGDAASRVEALALEVGAYQSIGQHQQVIDAARAVRAYAAEIGLSRREGSSASVAESQALFELGQITESAQVLEAAFLDQPANQVILSQLHLLAAQVSIVRGAYDAAATHLEAARLSGATPEEEIGRGWLATVRAELARSYGRLDEVRSIVDATGAALAAAPTFSYRGDLIWGLVEVGLDAEATRTDAARAAGDDQVIGEIKTVASRLLGYVDDVRRLRDLAGLPETPVGARGEEAFMEGHLARIEGRDDPALWEAPASVFPSRSPRALAARYRQAEAMLAIRAPREDVHSVMTEAHATAIDIGAGPLASRFEALARRARIDLRPPPSSLAQDAIKPEPNEPPPPPGTAALRGRGLSDREIEVLTLVAAGFSNRDIGARLFISDKTASVHVSHILAKLGVASRTEAATIGVRLGLPDVERDDLPS
jgi:DNA-binding CsgD family transcriptional regulator/tetratricopeptide (TPR) repeat protein